MSSYLEHEPSQPCDGVCAREKKTNIYQKSDFVPDPMARHHPGSSSGENFDKRFRSHCSPRSSGQDTSHYGGNTRRTNIDNGFSRPDDVRTVSRLEHSWWLVTWKSIKIVIHRISLTSMAIRGMISIADICVVISE